MTTARRTPVAPTRASATASSKPSRLPGRASSARTWRTCRTRWRQCAPRVDGSTSSAATVNTYVAAVKALLGFAHKVGLTRFNAAPLIKLRKAPRKTAQRLLSQVELHLLIRAARSRRDRLMLFCSSTGRAARERLHVLPNSSSHMVVMIPMIVMPIMPIMMVVIVMNLIDDAR